MYRWSLVVVLVLALLFGAMALRSGLTSQEELAWGSRPIPPTPWDANQEEVLVAWGSRPIPPTPWVQ
jgi:hypothetical protein